MYKIFIVTMALIVAITPFAMIYWAMKNQRPKRRSYYVNRYDIGGTDGGSGGWGDFGGGSGGGDSGGGGDGGD